jgi:NADH-ubiquinone oxidoreductase chain 4L
MGKNKTFLCGGIYSPNPRSPSPPGISEACFCGYANNFKTNKYRMHITLILFLIGILGFLLNRNNIILMLISIEIMLLSITFLILVSSLNIDDGQTYPIYIIVVAGAESAIGLGILVLVIRSSSFIYFLDKYS